MKKINLLLLSLVMLLFSCSKSSVSGGGSDTAPAAPTNVRITPLSDGSYYVSWVDNSTNEDGFIVTTSTGDTVVNSTTTNETKTTYTATVSSKPSNVSSRNSFGARPSNPATVDVVNITGIKITNSLGVTQIWMEKTLTLYHQI